ncbi:MAG: AbrB/MazE/SpoVT family DNA-binding domain-containing protein [Gemmatimonadota bacterium]|nr:AbrB/MazE/SpoVT family DNA-binding domain-containing protein [Gemmatimonadota bacterium]
MPKVLGFLTVDHKGRTTIPQGMRRELGIGEGTQIRVERSDDGVFALVPGEVIPHDQLWFHTPEVQAGISKAEKDFRDGRSTRTDGPEAAQRYLDSLKGRSSGGKNRKG